MKSGAAERVAASRAAITRQWVADASAARGEGAAPPPAGLLGAVVGWALNLAGARDSVPPLRAWLQLACSLGEELLSPLAQRHPLALVGGAALGGALLVSARPWRWRMRPPVLTRLFTQVALAAVAQGLGRPR